MHGVCVNRHLQHSCCIWERHRRWSVEMGKSKHHLLKHLLSNFFLPPLQTKSTIQILNQRCAHCKYMHSVIVPHAVKVQVQNQSSGVEEVILHRFNKITCQISKEQQQKPSSANHLKHLWKRNSSLVTAATESLRFKFNLSYVSFAGILRCRPAETVCQTAMLTM